MTDAKIVSVLKNRAGKAGIFMTDEQAQTLITLLRAQGWKLVAQNADEGMIAATKDIRNDNRELIFAKMWEAA